MEPNTEQLPVPPPKRVPAWPFILVASLVAAGLGVWRVLSEPQGVVEPPVAIADAGVPIDAGPQLSIADGDALLKRLGAGWSKDATYAEWLRQLDIRRLVAATQQIAEGESPRSSLPFLAIAGPFAAREEAATQVKPPGHAKKKGPPPAPGRVFIAPETYARYDALTQVFGSVDAAAAGDAWAQLEPFCDVAFGEIGRPGVHFHDVLGAALRRVLSVKVLDGEVELVPKGTGYGFREPAIEALSAAEKHLLRMGPKNGRVIQAQLRTFSEHARLDGSPK